MRISCAPCRPRVHYGKQRNDGHVSAQRAFPQSDLREASVAKKLKFARLLPPTLGTHRQQHAAFPADGAFAGLRTFAGLRSCEGIEELWYRRSIASPRVRKQLEHRHCLRLSYALERSPQRALHFEARHCRGACLC
eukprot:scaffold194849_cov29-Tisochrysis_lutea.AAC.3